MSSASMVRNAILSPSMNTGPGMAVTGWACAPAAYITGSTIGMSTATRVPVGARCDGSPSEPSARTYSAGLPEMGRDPPPAPPSQLVHRVPGDEEAERERREVHTGTV